MITFDRKYLEGFVSEKELGEIRSEVLAASEKLIAKTGAGSEFLGWVDLPETYDKEEFARIRTAAEKIRRDSEVLIVIGIGGSYLGARAAVEFLLPAYAQKVSRPEIYFAGNSISGSYLSDLIRVIGDRDFSVNVISKSGTTTEPAIAFRVFRELLEKKYGKAEAAKRIYATTDRKKGALKVLSDAEGYEEFVVPDDIGGRYSVLTAVGLLPIAAAGIDISELMKGAAEMRKQALTAEFPENGPMLYAACRNLCYRKGKMAEVLSNYEPSLHYFAEWWKQLFGESEGKEGKGLFPASVDLTTDLHSMGQYLQDGSRILLETVLDLRNTGNSMTVPGDTENLDGLNYLSGRTLESINQEAMRGTVLAHYDGGVPVLRIEISEKSAFALGELFYFFEYAVGVSGYMLGINPFDQPGVESYKKNMFALLGKPGYEELGEELHHRC